MTRWSRPSRESYRSHEAFEAELSAVFARHWILVADIAIDLPDRGSYVTEVVGGEPIVVLRDEDDRIRAFSNVCRHRSATVVEGAGTASRGLTCPYHGWRYGLDGCLRSVPLATGFERHPCDDGLALKELQVEEWARFAFVNLAGQGPDLATYLGEVASLLDPGQAVTALRTNVLEDVVEANWKVLLENAFEDYHVAFVHSGSIGRHYNLDEYEQRFGKFTAIVSLPLRPSAGEVYASDEGVVIGAAVFPNLVVTTWPNGSFSMMSWLPRTPTETRARVWAYSLPDRRDPRSGDEGREFLARIQAEDYAMCRRVQAGITSVWAEEGPLHRLEQRQQVFFQRLAEALETPAV